jgi:hypothetical protein
MGFVDDGALSFGAMIGAEEDHDPVMLLPELVGSSRVGKKGGERPFAPSGMQDRKPCLAGGIEAARRDLREIAGPLAVLPVDVEKKVDAWLAERRPNAPPDPRQHSGQRSPHHLGPARTHSGHFFQAPSIGGILELFESGDVQGIMDPLCQLGTDA